jgi:hypothetical protein
MLLASGDHFEFREIGWNHCETDYNCPSTGLSIVEIRRHNYRFESGKDRVESWLSTPPDEPTSFEFTEPAQGFERFGDYGHMTAHPNT